MSTQVTIPTLRTARLVLRAFAAGDLDDYAAVRAAPEVAEFTGGKTLTPLESWTGMAAACGQWALRGYGMLAVEWEGRVVGHVGLLHPADWPEAELAYALGPAAWGRGLATEAAGAVRDWAFGTLGFARLVSFIMPANRRSARVAEKLGAVRDGTVELRGMVGDRWVHRRGG